MRVLAVPRSMDRSLENMPRNFLNIEISRFAEGEGGRKGPGRLRPGPCPDKELFRSYLPRSGLHAGLELAPPGFSRYPSRRAPAGPLHEAPGNAPTSLVSAPFRGHHTGPS